MKLKEVQKKILILFFIFSQISSALGAEEEISHELADDVIKKFAPLVKLYKGEEYLPSSVDWYIERCSLKKDPTQYENEAELILNKPTIADLEKISDEHTYLTPRMEDRLKTLKGPSLGIHSLVGQEQIQTVTAPCYANFIQKENGAVIQYSFFYTYNGNLTWILGPIGTHEGDWEHIDVHLVKERGQYKIDHAYYDRHGSNGYGAVYSANELEYALETHPVVYSAYHGHASYPKSFNFFNRILDRTASNGPQWKCWENIINVGTLENPTPGQEWIRFKGRWGVDGNTAPTQRDWWRIAADQKLQVFSVDTFPLSVSLHQPRGSNNFNLGGEVPIRVKKINWRIDHPQAQSITFFVGQDGWLADRSQVYGPLSGQGTLTDISELKYLYISHISSTEEIKDAETLKIIVEAVEQ